jgi:hypothetical protein
MFGYFLMGIGGLSVIILVIGFAVVMFIAARDLWKAGSPGNRFFAVMIGTLGVLLVAPLIISTILSIYQAIFGPIG